MRTSRPVLVTGARARSTIYGMDDARGDRIAGHRLPSSMTCSAGVVVEQSAGVVPSGLGVDDAGWPVPFGGGEVEAGRLLAPGPADEVPGFAAMGGVIAGQPGVEVALPGGGQAEATGGEPVQQRDGGPDVPLDGDGLAVGDVLAAGAVPEPAQGVPDGVAAAVRRDRRVRRWWR
jgi:hypothetical protein